MRIVIAGAGAVGTHLAKMFSVESENVVLLDESEEKLGKMESLFDLQAIVGDPTKISALMSAGVGDAELFVAVTPDESRNIISCILAHYLGAKKTIARIDNYEYLQPKNKAYFNSLGVDSLIYPEQLAAEEIVTSISDRYIELYENITGSKFEKAAYGDDTYERIEANVKNLLARL